METLLTLSPGSYLAVEEALRIASILTAFLALLLLLSAAATTPRLRLPLFVGGLSLGAAFLLQHDELTAWRDAFELAGSSYCVTGRPLDAAAPVLAWAICVPGLLLALAMARIPWGRAGSRLLEQNAVILAAMGGLTLFHWAGYILILWSGYLACIRMPRFAAADSGAQGYVAFGAVIAAMVLKSLGSHHLLPLGNGAEELLVHGTLVRTVSDSVAFLTPGLVLLVRVLSRTPGETSPEKILG